MWAEVKLSFSAPRKRIAQVLSLTQENAVELHSLGTVPLTLAATVGGGVGGIRRPRHCMVLFPLGLVSNLCSALATRNATKN